MKPKKPIKPITEPIKLNYRDREAMQYSCNAIRNCQRYNTTPGSHFLLLVRLYRLLDDAGLIELEEEA